jgi:hypothetical protein
MEIENGAFAKKEVFFVSGSGFHAEAGVGARRLNLNRCHGVVRLPGMQQPDK